LLDLRPIGPHSDSWHNDVDADEGRLVGMSINLGEEPYEGGVFRMRYRETQEVFAEIPNTVPGDATLFHISRELQHMVTAVTGEAPKTAFAGWFRSHGTGFADALRGASLVERQG
jgi:hypothetical protein